MQRLLAPGCADDKAEVIRHRLDVLTETASPLIDYRDRGILVEVDGDQPPESINRRHPGPPACPLT
jgi:adenylate kinase